MQAAKPSSYLHIESMNDSIANRQTAVIVVGAGPTGLTLACDLIRRGLRVCIVEQKREPFAGSRAKGIQPRTLEVFDDLGILEEIVSSGLVGLPYREYTGDGGVHDVP